MIFLKECLSEINGLQIWKSFDVKGSLKCFVFGGRAPSSLVAAKVTLGNHRLGMGWVLADAV